MNAVQARLEIKYEQFLRIVPGESEWLLPNSSSDERQKQNDKHVKIEIEIQNIRVKEREIMRMVRCCENILL